MGDANEPGMEAIGIELAKATGVDGFFEIH
jgi:hypothetical protein